MRLALRPVMTRIPAAILLFSPAGSDPATIRVPAEQPTIAAALASATAGDEVVVDCGTYDETMLTIPSGVTLRGAVLDPECVQVGKVRITSGSDVRLQSLAISHLYSWRSSLLLIQNSSGVLIEGCTFRQNAMDDASCLASWYSDVTVRSSRFAENDVAIRDAHNVTAIVSNVTLEDCDFEFNQSFAGYGNAMVWLSGGHHTLRSCRFTENIGGALDVDAADVIVENSVLRRSFGVTYWFSDSIVMANQANVVFRRCLVDSVSGWRAVSGSTVRFEECTFANLGVERFASGSAEYDRCVFYRPRVRHLFSLGADVRMTCCDVFDFSGTWFDGTVTFDTSGVIRDDPRFCGIAGQEYTLRGDSPCLAGASPCGQQIGAFGLGCSVVSLEPQSWARIKSLYR